MKKCLLLLPLWTVMLFAGCDKDDEFLTHADISGKWMYYETIENGITKPAALPAQLGYFNFKTDGTYEEYEYYYNETITGTYTLDHNSITMSGYDGSYELTQFEDNTVVLNIQDDYAVRLKRTDNTRMPFLEPSVNFGATRAQIKAEERRTFDEEVEVENPVTVDKVLYFKGSSNAELAAEYDFAGDRMLVSGVYLYRPELDVDELFKFLSEKYTLAESSATHYIYFGKTYSVTVVLLEENLIGIMYYPLLIDGKSDTNDYSYLIERAKQMKGLPKDR